MCGACGGGGRAGPSWEDVAGRLDADGQRARARAVRRLLDGTRWKAEPWHGSWAVTAPGGQQHHAADLDALFALLPTHVRPARGPVTYATASPPSGWDVQAGLVWAAAAGAAGVTASVMLPLADGRAVHLRLAGRQIEAALRPGSGDVEVEAADAAAALDRLLTVAVR